MIDTPENRQYARRSLLAAVMFVIFVAVLAGANWLVQTRQQGARNAAQLLAEVRETKLPHYWPAEPSTTYFLAKGPDGRSIGWRREQRIAFAGGYRGQSIMLVPGSGAERELWQLDDTATVGKYAGPTEKRSNRLTKILLDHGSVRVQQLVGNTLVKEAQSPTPDNYMPEGLTPLMVRLVAQNGHEAVFRTILNIEAIVDGQSQINFGVLRLEPIDRTTVRVETHLSAGAFESTYHLNAQGQIIEISDPDGMTQVLTPVDKVLHEFPSDRLLHDLAAGRPSQTTAEEEEE